MTHPVWGLLAIGGSHIDAHNAWPLRGLLTFGGEGRDLTERWLGVDTRAPARSTSRPSTTAAAWVGS